MALLIIELDKRIGNAQWRDTFRSRSRAAHSHLADACEVRDMNTSPSCIGF